MWVFYWLSPLNICVNPPYMHGSRNVNIFKFQKFFEGCFFLFLRNRLYANYAAYRSASCPLYYSHIDFDLGFEKDWEAFNERWELASGHLPLYLECSEQRERIENSMKLSETIRRRSRIKVIKGTWSTLVICISQHWLFISYHAAVHHWHQSLNFSALLHVHRHLHLEILGFTPN